MYSGSFTISERGRLQRIALFHKVCITVFFSTEKFLTSKYFNSSWQANGWGIKQSANDLQAAFDITQILSTNIYQNSFVKLISEFQMHP